MLAGMGKLLTTLLCASSSHHPVLSFACVLVCMGLVSMVALASAAWKTPFETVR